MRSTPLEEVARVIGARMVGVRAGRTVRGVCIDSRRAGPDELFFALRGRVDGAEYAGDALARGAVAVVAGRPVEGPTLVVGDPLDALQRLARWSIETWEPEPPVVVGITGSVGKTTTKDALAAILRTAGRHVTATGGNYNNEIGLPLTVLSANESSEVMVLEMGATHEGDIAHLCRIAPPRVGVLTAIAPVHLDTFGSIEGIARGKGELARSLPDDGVMVAPVGVPPAAIAEGRNLRRRITFGRGRQEGVDLWASEVREGPEGLGFRMHLGRRSVPVQSPVFGTHLVEPLLAASGGALALGLSLEECAAGLSRVKRTGLRGEVYRLRGDIVLYDDTYNASPAAMQAVLRYARAQAGEQGRRCVAVLGGMYELGLWAREYHREIGRLADELGFDLLVCVGDEARWYAEGFSGEAVLCGDVEEAHGVLEERLEDGDYVVVKGSRGVGLDALTRRLRENLAVV